MFWRYCGSTRPITWTWEVKKCFPRPERWVEVLLVEGEESVLSRKSKCTQAWWQEDHTLVIESDPIWLKPIVCGWGGEFALGGSWTYWTFRKIPLVSVWRMNWNGSVTEPKVILSPGRLWMKSLWMGPRQEKVMFWTREAIEGKERSGQTKNITLTGVGDSLDWGCRERRMASVWLLTGRKQNPLCWLSRKGFVIGY